AWTRYRGVAAAGFGRWTVWRGFSGCYGVILEFCGLRRCCYRRLTLIRRCPKLLVSPRRLHMLSLLRHGLDMSFALSRFLFGCGTRRNSALATVITDPVDRSGVVNHGCVVNIVDVGDIHVVHSTVVEKSSVIPASPFVASARISKPVNDPS